MTDVKILTDEELAIARQAYEKSGDSLKCSIGRYLATITERARERDVERARADLNARAALDRSIQLAAAEAQVAALTKALEPFARAGVLMDLVRLEDAQVVYTPVIDANYCITAGDLRAAKAALHPFVDALRRGE